LDSFFKDGTAARFIGRRDKKWKQEGGRKRGEGGGKERWKGGGRREGGGREGGQEGRTKLK